MQRDPESNALRHTFFLLIIYAVTLAVSYLAGYRPRINYAYYQLLDRDWLEHDLLRSLFYLHAQPPLLNTLLGLCLWLQKATAIKAETILYLLNSILGGVVVVSLAGLARGLIKNSKIYLPVTAVFIVNPALYDWIVDYFYTFYELVVLSLIMAYANRYFKTKAFRPYLYVCILAVGLVYTRSLFHPLWAVLLISSLPSLAGPQAGRDRIHSAKIVGAIALSVLVLLVWPLKNYHLFGVFGYSSWQGYNIGRGLPHVINLLPPPYEQNMSDWQDNRMRLFDVPAKYGGIPALVNLRKADGHANWNHYSIIGLSKVLQSKAVALVLDQPWRLLEKAAYCYLQGYTVYEGRNPFYKNMGRAPTDLAEYWMKGYELLVFQGMVLEEGNDKQFPLNGFTFLFPVVMICSVILIAKTWRDGSSETKTAALMMYCIVWVLAMALFIDGYESNRMRFSTEPFIFILAGWLIARNRELRTKSVSS
jgi:hypothetical protein